jgi:hypothetical protein
MMTKKTQHTKPAKRSSKPTVTARAELIAAQIRFVRSIEGTEEERAARNERNALLKKMANEDWRQAGYVCGIIAGWAGERWKPPRRKAA